VGTLLGGKGVLTGERANSHLGNGESKRGPIYRSGRGREKKLQKVGALSMNASSYRGGKEGGKIQNDVNKQNLLTRGEYDLVVERGGLWCSLEKGNFPLEKKQNEHPFY